VAEALPEAVEGLVQRVGGLEAARLLRDLAATLEGLPALVDDAPIVPGCLRCGCRSFERLSTTVLILGCPHEVGVKWACRRCGWEPNKGWLACG